MSNYIRLIKTTSTDRKIWINTDKTYFITDMNNHRLTSDLYPIDILELYEVFKETE
jgi:hypothetical protein